MNDSISASCLREAASGAVLRACHLDQQWPDVTSSEELPQDWPEDLGWFLEVVDLFALKKHLAKAL